MKSPIAAGNRSLPVALTIAGSDNSAGAGIQADLKVFSALGCYGLTAVTCVVSEVPGKVAGIQAVKPALVRSQVELCAKAFPVKAVKTGMLFSAAVVRHVAEALKAANLRPVVDPVMVASSGDPLIRPEAIEAYKKWLFPMAKVVTPNLDELACLVGRPIRNLREMTQAGKELSRRFGCAFLLKGGHLRGKDAVDILVDGGEIREFRSPFFRGVSTHGTGCTYSAAITAGLAEGKSLALSIESAKLYISETLRTHLRWGRTGALNHFLFLPTTQTPSQKNR